MTTDYRLQTTDDSEKRVVLRDLPNCSLRSVVCGLILWSVVCGLWSSTAFAGNRDALVQQARQLSWDKHYDEAIGIYEQLLQKNPDDVEAAIGLATVTAWKGDYPKAETLFETLSKDYPLDRDILFGLSRVLLWQGKIDESRTVFDQLLALYPDDAEALAEREKLAPAKSAATDKPFMVRAYYRFEDLSFTSNAHGAGFLVSYRIKSGPSLWGEQTKKWSVRGGFDTINKFGDSAPGYRVGGSYWATDNTVLSLDIELAPKQVVVPRQAYTFEISQTIFKQLVPSISYRFADYSTANAHIVAPGVTWYFYPRFDWMARYFLSISQFGGQSSINHSMMTRLNWNLIDPVNIFVGYSRANESFESGNPVAPTGGFSADHVFLGGNWKFYKEVGLDFTFDFEKRNNGSTLKTYETALFYRW